MDRKTPHRRHRRTLLPAIVAALALSAGAACAQASSSIEGVWFFGGGEIAVHHEKDGTYVGTVVVPTSFAECVHPELEEIWTEMTPQPDGSFWGKHQWFFEKTECLRNPERGPAAWRVLEGPGGSQYLLVCLSSPGKQATQPTIAPNGSTAGATYGCIKSKLTSGTGSGTSSTTGAGVSAFIQKLIHPGARKCFSARRFEIHIAEPQYDPFKTIAVTLKGHRLRTVHRGKYILATIDLKGRPPGAFTLEIKATTILGLHLSGTRTYHTCAARRKHYKPPKLKVQR